MHKWTFCLLNNKFSSQFNHAVLQDLLFDTQCIQAAPPDFNSGDNCFRNALRSAIEHNLPHEILEGKQVNDRFPGYSLPPNFQVTYHSPQLLPRLLDLHDDPWNTHTIDSWDIVPRAIVLSCLQKDQHIESLASYGDPYREPPIKTHRHFATA